MTQQTEKTPVVRAFRRKTHQGRAVKAILDLLNYKPDVLAEVLNITPRSVSTLLTKDEIDPNKLELIAAKLEVPVALLENFDPKEAIRTLISENCTQTNTDIKEHAAVAQAMNAEKVVGQEYSIDPNTLASFERMLKEERQKSDALFRDNIEMELKIKELEKIIAEKE